MKIQNPILPGFHPDASVVQVGKDYYLATSTFEWWPGVEIYHSTNLVEWQLVAQPLQRISQVDLRGNYNSGSIWAPHLSYSEGKFWLAYTDVKSATMFKDTLNYVITAPSIEGPWSEPVFVTASGFDPAFFHDDDGKHYFLNMLFDYRPGHQRFAGTVIQEFDVASMQLVGQRRHFYKGNSLGVCEGPQILKKDGYYYLLCAAGGTGYQHAATVARCNRLDGEFEESPYFPLLTTADSETASLQKSGHACFVSIGEEWYITHICARPLTTRGNCVLGRETALQKIEWVDGWPRLCNQTHWPDLEVEAPLLAGNAVQKADYSEEILFANCEKIPPTLKTLRGPLTEEVDYSLTQRKGYLRLYGGQSLSSLHKQHLFARRWQTFNFCVQTEMEFYPSNFQHMAGLILFYDTEHWFYAYMSYDEQKSSPVLQVLTAVGGSYQLSGEPIFIQEGGIVTLKAQVRHGKAQFFYACKNDDFNKLGEELNVEVLSDDYIMENSKRMAFTGAMAGICVQDMDCHTCYADFKSFSYQEDKNAEM